jgi:hypothetical protein
MLLDRQPPAARMLDLLCIDEMFSIRTGQRVKLTRTPARTASDGRPRERTTQSFG